MKRDPIHHEAPSGFLDFCSYFKSIRTVYTQHFVLRAGPSFLSPTHMSFNYFIRYTLWLTSTEFEKVHTVKNESLMHYISGDIIRC
jgi:hypothetical protein